MGVPERRAVHTRRHARTALCLIGLLASGLIGPAAAPVAAAAEHLASPRLVLVIVIDQLRTDRVSQALPGAIGRLAREGRFFADAALEHARTETCPGHASILTGRHPGPAGIPANRFFVDARREPVYCAQDESESGRLLNVGRWPAERGRSPQRLRVQTLGDWLKAAHPESRVFAVSAKDRAAIMLGGRHPDAAYWLDQEQTGRFTTSRYYATRLPDWVRRWDGEHLLAPLATRWTYAEEGVQAGARRDEYAAESPRFGRASPHPVKSRGNLQKSLAQLAATPYLDQRTLDFARDLVRNEDLGVDEHVDLLAVSLSGNDYIGHHYGPRSQEARHALERLDEDLDLFLRFLEGRTGTGRLFVVLTSDHGVLPLPEWLREHESSQATCPVASGRIGPETIERALTRRLGEEFGRTSLSGDLGGLLVRSGFSLRIDRAGASDLGVGVDRIAELVGAELEKQPGIARIWHRQEIERGEGPEPMATFFRNSQAERRGGDLLIQPARGCLLTAYPAGTSHGSPWLYDRAVPLIFFGPGVAPGRIAGSARTVDIAPTLARVLGLGVPEGLDGRPLALH